MKAVIALVLVGAVLALASTMPAPYPRIPANIGGCTQTASPSATLQVVGLPGGDAQPCISTTIQATNNKYPIADKQAMFPIDLTGFDQQHFSSFDLTVFVWNHKQLPYTGTSRTEVSLSGGSPANPAFAIANVDANGVITSVTITNPGSGYTSAPSCSFSITAQKKPTMIASCRAVICKQGTVTGIYIDNGGMGYAPGGAVWNDAWFQKMKIRHASNPANGAYPALAADVDLTGYSSKNKDSNMCECGDVWNNLAACTCVSAGYWGQTTLSASSCDEKFWVVLNTIVPVELSIMVTLTPKTATGNTLKAKSDLYSPFWDTLPANTATDFVSWFGGTTNFKLSNPGGMNPARRWWNEMRVTLSTPTTENWYCGSNPWATDCSVTNGAVANITVDAAHVSGYNLAPLVMIGMPTRAITAVAVTTAGAGYTGRPVVTAVRTPPSNSDTLTSVTVLNGGSGYFQPPTISFSGPGTAKASAVVDPTTGAITSITVTDAGSGWGRTPPTVTITPRTEISQIVLTDCGAGYSAASPPAVWIPENGFPYLPAYAYASVDANGALSGITMIQRGSGYDINSPPTVIIGKRMFSIAMVQTGAGYTSCVPTVQIICTGGCTEKIQRGQPATATANLNLGSIVSINITSYSVFVGTDPTVTILDGTCTPTTQATAQPVMSTTPTQQATASAIPTQVVGASASAYATVAYQYGTDGPEADAQFAVTMSTDSGCDLGGQVQNVAVVDGGSGYTASATFSCTLFSGTFTTQCAVGNPSVNVGSQAYATASVDASGQISGFTVTTPGSGYTCAPTVTLVTLGRLVSLRVMNPGFGYTAPPIVTISGGTGATAPATATASIDAQGRVTGLTLGNPSTGFSYSNQPVVTITPRYEIIALKVTACGSGYSTTTPPTVCIVHNSGTPGWGAKFTANVNALGEITGFTRVSGGQGYFGGTFTVRLIGSHTTGASASVDLIGNNPNVGTWPSPAPSAAATADAIWEHGQGATAEATIAGGAVTGINIVSNAAPYYDLWDTTPFSLSIPAQSTVTFTPVFNSGFLTGFTMAQRDGLHGGVSISAAGPLAGNPRNKPKYQSYLGGSLADVGGTTPILRTNTDGTVTIPWAWVTYGQTSKVYSYYDVSPMLLGSGGGIGASAAFWIVTMTAPADATFPSFPNSEYRSNNQLTGAVNSLLLKNTVKVELMEYPDLATGAQTGNIVRGGRPLRFQLTTTAYWSRVWLTYSIATGVAGYETLGFQYAMGSSPSWTAYNKATGILRVTQSGFNSGDMGPSVDREWAPMIIEVDLSGCQGADMTNSIAVTVTATVTEFAGFPESECNHYLDCNHPMGQHPTAKMNRASVSSNGDASRFRLCGVAPDSMTGKCMECLEEADCNFGQYCHMDTGTCTQPISGIKFACDNSSRALYGTCQWKDPRGDTLGQPCRAVSSSGAASYAKTANPYRPTDQKQEFVEPNIFGYCGRDLYYNDSYFDVAYLNTGAGFANRTRATLWTGYCINQVCLECQEGAYLDSNGRHRVCVDGKWQPSSGTGTFGQLQADTKATRDAVTKGTAVSSSMLAFVIVISVVVAIVLFCYLKGGSRGGKGGGTEMGRA